MYDLANVNEDGGSVVLWPHLSAFLIAAIKVPGPRFSPPDTGKSCLRRCTFWLRVVGGLKAHRFGGSPRRESGSQPNRNSQRNGLCRDIFDSRTKKKEIDSPRRKRGLLSTVSPTTLLLLVLQSRVLSLKVSSGSIDYSLSLSLLSFFLFISIISAAKITVQTVCVRIVQLGSSYDIFAVFFNSTVLRYSISNCWREREKEILVPPTF